MKLEEIKPIPKLIGDIADQFGRLVRSETRLAQAELAEKIAEAVRGVTYIALAGVLIIPATVLLLITLAMWLHERGMPIVLAYLSAAAAGIVLSALFGAIGLSRLKAKHFRLTHTVAQVEKDVAAARSLAK